ncbi:MAG TPA: lysylphosphatidylglycerol synthase transmembrane domain-containing protein [Anaerolineales bacterium]|nr:lysylphosphatidylglycerol synthase transmembrane domain-containing protein [Anaerolineales bacterium]
MTATFRRWINFRSVFAAGLVAFLFWALQNAPLREIWAVLQGLSLAKLLVLIGLNLFILILLSLRWQLIVRALGRRVSLRALFGYRLGAFGVSYFTPGPQFGGEPLQVYLLKERHRLTSGAAISAVTLDKIFDLLANFAFLVFGATTIARANLLPSLETWRLLSAALVLLALPVAYLLLLKKGYRPASRGLAWIARQPSAPKAWCRMRPAFYRAEAGIARFYRQRPAVFLQALALSLIVWALMLLEYWLMLYFLGLRLDLIAVISALTAARLAFLTPSPGGLGVLEASQVIVFQALGAGPALALSVALLIRARDLSLGVTGLWLVGALTRPARPAQFVPEASD